MTPALRPATTVYTHIRTHAVFTRLVNKSMQPIGSVINCNGKTHPVVRVPGLFRVAVVVAVHPPTDTYAQNQLCTHHAVRDTLWRYTIQTVAVTHTTAHQRRAIRVNHVPRVPNVLVAQKPPKVAISRQRIQIVVPTMRAVCISVWLNTRPRSVYVHLITMRL